MKTLLIVSIILAAQETLLLNAKLFTLCISSLEFVLGGCGASVVPQGTNKDTKLAEST